MRKWICVLFVVSLAAYGCGDDSSGSGDNGGSNNTNTAPQAHIDECKGACNQQKFFDCYDAAAHANCFQDCEQSSTSDIETFVNCVGVEICDPECANHIEPPAPPPEPSASDCEAACDGLIADQCIPQIDCATECGQLSSDDKNFIVYCADNRNGCEFPEACQFEGEETTPQEECAAGCETMGTFDCIQATDVSECTTICQGLEDAAATSFATCVRADGICQDDSCYQQINEGGGSADVAGCKDACNDMAFFDCLDATGQSECRSACESAEKSDVDDFKACVDGGICEDSTCYDVNLAGG